MLHQLWWCRKLLKILYGTTEIKIKDKQMKIKLTFHHLIIKPSISDLFWNSYIYGVLVIYCDKKKQKTKQKQKDWWS